MNIKSGLFHGRVFRHFSLSVILICVALATVNVAAAADKVWAGNGSDHLWTTPANWAGGVAPVAGDSLFFGGTRHLVNTNDFSSDTSFGNLTFTSPAGAFTLAGNEIDLAGNLTNKQVVTPETISIPLILTLPVTVDVVPNGELDLNGVVSGSGGLTTVDGGLLSLSGANTFAGGVTVNGGTVAVGADNNLGTGNLALDGGRLETTASFTLNAGRGIAVGPGWGGIKVDPGTSLSYGGVIADNGGSGAFVKNGYGSLTLFGQSTYTGATSNRVGTITLDFTQATSPASNILPPTSDLTLGGENAGLGGENEAELNILGAAGTTSSQSFNSTHMTFAGSVIRATSGTGGQVNLSLGTLSHDPGGTLLFIPPAAGSFTTSPGANVNGILGGWATIGNGAAFTANGNTVLEGTNYATVDASGNITNFTGYDLWSSGNLAGQVTVQSNLLFQPSSPSVITVDNANANTTTTVNTIKVLPPETGTTAHYYGIYIGAGNTLRLGQYGGILKDDFSEDVITIGGVDNTVQSGSGTIGSGDIGTVTAGGADNTPGEIVVDANAHDESHGTTIFEAAIADNGTGPVTFVKTGPGSIKLDGHNTFSGGLYLLQGRVQFAGHEIGNDNPDGGGTGPIYILPGSYLFPSGIGTGAITNSIFVAGSGDAAEPLGAFRGGTYSGPITLIGDATFGGNATFDSAIQGPFNVTLGSPATINGGATLNNPADAWTGNTTMTARSNTGNNTITCGTNNVIPSGFGMGNVTMVGYSSGTVTWNLNGFNQTINGLSSSGTSASCIIENAAASTVSTLTIGNNDQSGTFGGILEDGGGQLALTKIGGGVETLTGVSSYTGPTTVNDGVLALADPGSINSSPIQVNTNGTLDVSGLSAGVATTSAVGMNGGTFIGTGSVGALGATNAAFTFDLNPGTVNLTASSLSTGGATNLINISSVFGIQGYPAQFTVIQYAGTLGGVGNNFGIGTVPNPNTVGYVSNDVADSRIVLVLLNGPKVLTWTGSDPVNPTFWDLGTTTNWIAFEGTVNAAPSGFSQADSAIFDDTGSSSVNVTENVGPGFMEVTNNTLTYTFTGAGNISTGSGMIKDGTGTAILDNGGNNSLSVSGVLSINNGMLQVGNNDTDGGISATKGILDNSSLVFDRSDNSTNNSNISGTGSVSQNNTSILTLSGNSSFSGGLNVVPGGTLKAGSGSAFGAGTTTISSGATLDDNGQTITNAVVVSGSGVNGAGAIVNSAGQSLNAFLNVTLAGDTSLGGNGGRWDIRGTGSQLSTGGNAYNLTKIGTNYVALVGATVDSALANINVESGILSIETTTSGLGNPSSTLTVSAGATFQLYDSVNPMDKVFVLNGTGTNATVNCGHGVGNTIAGSSMTLNGACIFNTAAGATLAFTSGSTMSGSGSYLQTGTGINIIASGSAATYTGGTTVSNGTLVVDGSLSGDVQIDPGSTLGGTGNAGGNVIVQAGTVAPGDPDTLVGQPQGTLSAGTLTLSNATALFALDTTPSSSINDKVAVANALTLDGTNTIQIDPLTFMSVGDTYTLFTYTGTTLPSNATNQLNVVSTKPYFSFSVIDPSTTPGAVEIKVLTAVGNDVWTGANSSTWDTNTVNWTRNATPVTFVAGDVVNFDDSSTVTNVSLSGTLPVSGINVSGTQVYTFGGTGGLTGPSGLNLSGNELIVANGAANNFSGPITIGFSSILQVGNGGAGGSLGSGVVTNNNSLVFDRSDSALVVSNVIAGSGSLTNIGTGRVTLAGANTFGGQVIIPQGTLRLLNNNALGNPNLSSTYVSNGASLDFGANTVEVGAEPIYASGAGVGGQGAIMNDSGSTGFGGAGGNFYNLTMQGDTSIGGTGRLDMRNTTATPTLYMDPLGSPYNLNKVGSDLFQLVNVDVDPGLANINVMGGTLGVQGAFSLGLGDPSGNLTVFTGADFDMYSLTTPLTKVLILEDGGTVSGSHDANEFDGPVTLAGGTNYFNIHSGSVAFTGVISGPGNLYKISGATLILSNAVETYTGNTHINGGTLALGGTAAIAASPVIALGGGTLDATATTAAEFELFGGQSLIGNGTIVGPLVADAGSLVSPGDTATTAKIADGTAIALNGSVVMDLNQTNALMNDELIAPSITASGTLTVTNLGPDLETGSRFQLFSTNVTGFTSVNLPATSASGAVSYTWQDNIAVDGSITLLSGAPNLTPSKIGVSLGNGNITLSWPTNQIGWTLQMQTNSISVGLSTNWVVVPGSTATNQVTMPVDTTNGVEFFRLMYQP